MTAEVWFYQLERSSLDEVLPDLLQKSLARGWRALVWASDHHRLAALDGWLWTFSQESFLPHGLADEPASARQPILLTDRAGNPNGAKVLFLIDGGDDADVGDFERCILIFDGADGAALEKARSSWRKLKAGGAQVVYWRQKENRGWERQA